MAYRILILENEFGMGGSEKKLFEFISRTDRSRFRIAVCCLKKGGYFKSKLEDLGVPFYDGLLSHRFDALAFRGLGAVLRAEQTQLIYTFTHPNTVIFSYLARLRGLVDRFVVSYHAMGNPQGDRLVPRHLLPLLRRADMLLAVADMQRDYLVEVEGLPRRKFRVIHNGVDTSVYHPAAPLEREQIRAELGVPRGAVVFVAVASLKPAKRLDTLLRAAATVLGDQDRLLLVGDGPDRKSLAALAQELGVEDRVVFAGLRDDVARVLRACDVLVLPSRAGTETFPNVVLEAMATGLPVITTDVGSVREMVEDERSALVVPREDEVALRAAIERLSRDVGMRSALGVRGRSIVDARFRIENMCAAREALFEELLARSGKGARTIV